MPRHPSGEAQRLTWLLALAAFLCCAAWPAAGAARRPGAPKMPGVRVVRDLEYVAGGHERNRLDLYLPERAPRPLPVVVWVHGGGWTNGDKTNGSAFFLATNGYAVASMNYRFSQHAIFPAQIHDCKAAVRWLRANAAEYGLDADHIGAWGASAGGHLVALLGTTAGVKEFEGPGGNADQSSRVQAVVDWFGPTDFLTVGRKDTRTHLLGGDPQVIRDQAIKASPMTYVSKDVAPILIMHGDSDGTVPVSQSETFAAALKKAGADVTLAILKGGKHGGAAFAKPQTLKQVEDFFDRYLKRPNLVFVLADQLRYQSCGFAGDANARTPHLDALAREGVLFRNAVSGHPVCAAYRASLFTGKYTTSTGMVINELRMNTNHVFLAQVLTRHGYDTAYIGKWHLWANQLGHHYDPVNSFTPPGPYRLGFDGFWAAYNFHHEYYKGYYHTDSLEKIPVKGYEPDGQTDMAIDQIKRCARNGRPFALFLSLGTPHDPWTTNNVPAEYYALFADKAGRPRFTLPPNYSPANDPYADAWGRFKGPRERQAIPQWMRVYYAMAANLDWNLGRLLQAIDDAGVRERTIVVFSADHGEMMGAHGRRAKNIFYEEAVRVPFVMRWPGRIPAGLVSDACLNTPDIMPTLLGMAGLPVPAKVEGQDLSHCAFGRPGPEPEAALMENTGACALWEDGYEWRALRSKRYTYALYRKDRSELLFDNQSDPYQLRNLAADPGHQETLNHFRALLKERMGKLGDTFEASTWYRDHWVKDRVITYWH